MKKDTIAQAIVAILIAILIAQIALHIYTNYTLSGAISDIARDIEFNHVVYKTFLVYH